MNNQTKNPIRQALDLLFEIPFTGEQRNKLFDYCLTLDEVELVGFVDSLKSLRQKLVDQQASFEQSLESLALEQTEQWKQFTENFLDGYDQGLAQALKASQGEEARSLLERINAGEFDEE